MGHLLHLGRRLLGGLHPRRLGPGEQAEAAALVRPGEARLFWRQSPADQRHALNCARAVLASAPDRPDLARAALLHDVGKATARLGVPGRVLATSLSLLRLPAPGRWADYLAHAARGADELRTAGADPVVVAYARHHHGHRPPEVPARDWELLTRADRA